MTLKLLEAAEVSTRLHDQNCFSFNRVYLVLSESGGRNFLRNHSVSMDARGQLTALRTNGIYLIPANTDLEFSFDQDLRFISFHFYLDLFNQFDAFSGQVEFMTRRDTAGMAEAFSSILHDPTCDLGGLCRLQGLLLQLLGGFLEVRRPDLERTSAVVHRYLPVLEYIRSEADATTSIDELAKIAGVAKGVLSRAFSRDCGVTLKRHLDRSVIRKAGELLLKPGASARSVSERLNFNNEYYFSRFFKKHTGMTTQAYRRQLNEGLATQGSTRSL